MTDILDRIVAIVEAATPIEAPAISHADEAPKKKRARRKPAAATAAAPNVVKFPTSSQVGTSSKKKAETAADAAWQIGLKLQIRDRSATASKASIASMPS